ncbi:MAG TPA: UDP-N-acetylmuramoyl-tripeptide--D-alanyl-D-alanine ligase [Armatimonadota bacterium]|nr:UDP-N-acetylmuramoyl-tripeptide--D-alanyl-D-alanine ligase [Armatimonadota bacterium]HOQ27715.1 UDP-N-acetylmuramoyl-tripeptide--D-alanyl-D-alanine ligase [Armatimonadota bacterium]HPO72648.1 UDP-N-acetylmuramoyl-tripeptide--D-alanyl-D-alanine ligase [Armatimonadota bacterium]HPT97326.1 UDP-N-acetylmuramoyl-tripeptide--D-alanyl-D-alanine ligase [Armatimonadota bacterium]
MEPVSLEAIAGATGGSLQPVRGRPVVETAGNWPIFISSVCTDTRALTPGCVFVALKGPSFDGHRFVADAFQRGAVAALVERAQLDAVQADVQAGENGQQTPPPTATLIAVDDTLQALGDLARWYRSRFGIPVVGVTGSVGKTSTKEMVAAILGQRGSVVSTAANYNNEIGLPLTLFGIGSGHSAAVVEMAMRGTGQIRYLAEIAQPQIGVITNIGTSHLELLGSREAIARAKGELLELLPETGMAVLPASDGFLPLLRTLCRCQVTTFGFAGEGAADVAVAQLDIRPTESHFVLEAFGERIPVRLPLPGRHNALNAAAAAAAALQAGASARDVAAGLDAVSLPGMRMQVVRGADGVMILNDVYNASPSSMAAALEHLRHLPGKRHVAILGDMLELGAESEAGHRETGVAAAWVDLLIAVGERAREIAAGAATAGLPAERIHLCADAEAALSLARAHVKPGDAVLVKASRGMQLEIVVAGLSPRDEGGEGTTAHE